MSTHETLRRHSARYVLHVLRACDGNKTLACDQLGITWNTLTSYLIEAGQLRACDKSTATPEEA